VSESQPIHLGPLQQIVQHADDLERAVSFYRDVLGIHFIAKFDPPGLAFFDLAGTRLLLEGAAASTILYFRVPDIDAAYRALLDRGVGFEGEPHVIHRDTAGDFGPAGEEEWMAFFRDSEGNLLALASRRRASA
jgi:methylmalonyl-CoA/ethylmalonyl-CoA epimerase